VGDWAYAVIEEAGERRGTNHSVTEDTETRQYREEKPKEKKRDGRDG
jgi:hypothetical protein